MVKKGRLSGAVKEQEKCNNLHFISHTQAPIRSRNCFPQLLLRIIVQC